MEGKAWQEPHADGVDPGGCFSREEVVCLITNYTHHLFPKLGVRSVKAG